MKTPSSYPPATTSDEALSQFFLNPENYAAQSEEVVFRAVGRPDIYDDWDWGRLVYRWDGQRIAIRVIMQGGVVICVERLDPSDRSRFAEALEVLWQRPSGLI
ncbi:hypothetical protein [Calidithermus timidus]|jgi:hypothetical protein|uniref:hypothetical protein n=1 Tax=Calidithermus timidus TaxID=307124 RepID=UPI000A0217A8|nr:hypothetical protein [Calidithermus timidus]